MLVLFIDTAKSSLLCGHDRLDSDEAEEQSLIPWL